MTVGKGETNRYVVTDPGSTQFESRNPGTLFVALSRAQTADRTEEYPDFLWNPHMLVNEDRLCHRVDTPTTRALNQELVRLEFLSEKTEAVFKMFASDDVFQTIVATLENPLLRNKQSQFCCSSQIFLQISQLTCFSLS